ncbi:MAG: Wzz/FepE/Etk N-terminal domain-containing protein, partial [Gammaproteobacteria bacterium]|nr:Wzz/FepE/Etk N-terminal domain-containing protein [Gammaproteobacteria bacterium]
MGTKTVPTLRPRLTSNQIYKKTTHTVAAFKNNFWRNTMQDQPSQQPAPFQDDEIDLFELWNGLVQEKWTIVSVVLISLVLSVAYLILGSKTYQVETSYLPPFSKQVETLKY